MEYRSPADDTHLIDEERQWGRLLSGGDPRRGMALVYVQKFCTAVHEFEPAFRAALLDDSALEHVRDRLLARLDYALQVMAANELDRTAGLDELLAIRQALAAAPSLTTLIGLTDRIHEANHVVCEALER